MGALQTGHQPNEQDAGLALTRSFRISELREPLVEGCLRQRVRVGLTTERVCHVA